MSHNIWSHSFAVSMLQFSCAINYEASIRDESFALPLQRITTQLSKTNSNSGTYDDYIHKNYGTVGNLVDS